jgi:hypothetical protein
MEALKLKGKGIRTQEAYARHVRKLIEFFDKKDLRRSVRTAAAGWFSGIASIRWLTSAPRKPG